MELREALRLFLLVDRSETTTAMYTRILNGLLGEIGAGRPVDRISPEDLDYWVHALRERKTKYADHPQRPTEAAPLSEATIRKHVKTVRTFFNWCVERGVITASPARFIKLRRYRRRMGEGKAASDDDVGAVLSAARYKPRDWAIVLLLAQSGCRAGDVATLRLSQINLDDLTAIVDGKGGKRRVIVFGPETADAIRAWLFRRPADAGHDCVFTSTRGHGPLTAASVSQITRRLCKLAGLDHTLGAHAFRHFVARKLWRSRVDPRVIQHYLGHEDIATTLEYGLGVGEEDLHAASELLALGRRRDEDLRTPWQRTAT